jgi:hypothetical protein
VKTWPWLTTPIQTRISNLNSGDLFAGKSLRAPDLCPRPIAATSVFSAPPCGSPLLILRHGFSGELEVIEVQRRVWPQRDSNPCFSHDHIFASGITWFLATCPVGTRRD